MAQREFGDMQMPVMGRIEGSAHQPDLQPSAVRTRAGKGWGVACRHAQTMRPHLSAQGKRRVFRRAVAGCGQDRIESAQDLTL